MAEPGLVSVHVFNRARFGGIDSAFHVGEIYFPCWAIGIPLGSPHFKGLFLSYHSNLLFGKAAVAVRIGQRIEDRPVG